MAEVEGFRKPEGVQGEKGGETMDQWEGRPIPESDSLGEQHRAIDEAIADRTRARLTVVVPPERRPRPVNVRKAERAAFRRIAAEHLASMRATPEPGPQPSRVPYSTERMNFGPDVQQRGRR